MERWWFYWLIQEVGMSITASSHNVSSSLRTNSSLSSPSDNFTYYTETRVSISLYWINSRPQSKVELATYAGQRKVVASLIFNCLDSDCRRNLCCCLWGPNLLVKVA